MPNSLKCRLKRFVHKGLLSENDLSRIYTDNDVIEELEKIKAEIDLIKDSKRPIDDFDSGCERIKDLLDHHISELKGENK